MNYYLVFILSFVLLFLVYTPGIITFNFSRMNTVLQITFIPFAQWNGSHKDLKGNNWFGAARVLGGKATTYNPDGSLSHEYNSVDYFLRLFGFEFEYIVINTQESKV